MNGVVDTTFGSSGSVTLSTSSGPVAVQPDEKILVGGTMNVAGTDDQAVTRLNVNGSIDTTFGTDGTATADYNKFDLDEPFENNAQTLSINILSNGNILAGATAYFDGPSGAAAAEFLPNGKLDTSFGDGGEIGPFSTFTSFISIAGVIVQANGSFILAGGSYNGPPNNYFLARFTAAGIVDSSFGINGTVTVQFTNTDASVDSVNSIAATTDGKIVIVGDATDSSGFGFAVARYDLGLGTVSGNVFDDLNSDGIRESNEPGIFGQTVFSETIYGDQETTTDSNGDYTLTGLPLGPVIIRQKLLNGQTQTFPTQGFGQHLTVGMSAIDGVNFGTKVSQTTVSGTVFNDTNGNGAATPGESGLPGVTVYADLNNNGKLDPGEPETSTGANGQYTLSGLPTGPVIVRQLIPTGNRQTSPSSNLGQHVTAGSVPITEANFQDTTKIFVSGTVFDDVNGNGKQDAGEPGISGWTVYADLNNDGKFESNEPSKLVGTGGSFSFLALSADTYIFRVIPPAGWHQTFPTNNLGQHVTLSSGGVSSNLLFGFAPPATTSISGTVFSDANGNQKLDNTETGISGKRSTST